VSQPINGPHHHHHLPPIAKGDKYHEALITEVMGLVSGQRRCQGLLLPPMWQITRLQAQDTPAGFEKHSGMTLYGHVGDS